MQTRFTHFVSHCRAHLMEAEFHMLWNKVSNRIMRWLNIVMCISLWKTCSSVIAVSKCVSLSFSVLGQWIGVIDDPVHVKAFEQLCRVRAANIRNSNWRTNCKRHFIKGLLNTKWINLIVRLHSLSICFLGNETKWNGQLEVMKFSTRFRPDPSSGCRVCSLNSLKSKTLLPVQRLTRVSLSSCLQTIKFKGVCFTWFITVASYWLAVNSGSDSGRMSARWSHATEVAVNGSLFLSGQHCTPSVNNKTFVEPFVLIVIQCIWLRSVQCYLFTCNTNIFTWCLKLIKLLKSLNC